jgi:hypothetical protein
VALTTPKRGPQTAVILGGALLVIAAAAFGLCAFAMHRAEGAIQFHRAEVEAAERKGPTRTGTRGPIEGPEEPGSAWDLLTPAFEGVWALADSPEPGPSLRAEPNFTAHGSAGDTERLLELSAPHLAACRRSLRRRVFDGPGPVDVDSTVDQAVRVCRALCSKGFMAWQDSRDAEAADWLISALSVAQDVARLGDSYSRGLLHVTEAWVSEEAKFLFSEQGLTEAQLREFERRLDILRTSRPLPTVDPWDWGVRARREVLEESVWIDIPNKAGNQDNVKLADAVGWRDFWSPRFQKARVLAELRDAALQSQSLPWNSSGELAPAWDLLCAKYRPEDVGQIWKRHESFRMELVADLRWDFLRAAAAVARFEAAQGRMPKDLAETGTAVPMSRPFTIEGDRIVLDLTTGVTDSLLYFGVAPVEVSWAIRRR